MSDSETRQGVPTLASESAYPGSIMGAGEPVPFTFRSILGPAVLNPLNHKNLTLPILNLQSAHARNFHLSWLGFMVAL